MVSNRDYSYHFPTDREKEKLKRDLDSILAAPSFYWSKIILGQSTGPDNKIFLTWVKKQNSPVKKFGIVKYHSDLPKMFRY